MSFFFVCLEFRFSEQNDEIQPEKVTRKNRPKKSPHYQPLIFLAERVGFSLLHITVGSHR